MANKYCKLQVRVSEVEFNRFKHLNEHGFSTRKILEVITEKCSEFPITLFSAKTGEPIQIPPNIFVIKKK